MASRFFQCVNNPDFFCFVCGHYLFKEQRRRIDSQHCDLYEQYFGIPLGDQDKSWAPHTICSTCERTLKHWKESSGKHQMSFAVPMYWMEVNNHEDCYFCKTEISGFNKKNNKIKYPDVSTAKKPQAFRSDETRPVPSDSSNDSSSPKDNLESSFELNSSPILFTQPSLNDFVRNMKLSKLAAVQCGQTLKDQNLLESDCTYSWYRHREEEFKPFFKEEKLLTFCVDVE